MAASHDNSGTMGVDVGDMEGVGLAVGVGNIVNETVDKTAPS